MLDFINESVFQAKCDLLVVPFSTGGTLSQSFAENLDGLGVKLTLKRNQIYTLGDIEIKKYKGKLFKYIAFVCTVDDYRSSYVAIRKIGLQLGEKVNELSDVKVIAAPILGTGAGKLEHSRSRNILLNSFYEVANNSIQLNFYTPDKEIYNSFEGTPLDIYTPSSRLVIEAEVTRIVNVESVSKILHSEEFYYDLAVKKLADFFAFKPNSLTFFKRLANEFKSSGLTFSKFLPKVEKFNDKSDFLKICGELVAYIDVHAYRKNFWNNYPDKRVLALSGVHQTHWILNLLKLRASGNDVNSITAASIKNAILYLLEPKINLTMLSEKHRKDVLSVLFPAEPASNLQTLFDFFGRLGISSVNATNNGALYTRILYLPFIKPLWLQTKDLSKVDDTPLEILNIHNANNLILECIKNQSKILDLGNCGLRDLSEIPELFECTHIEELILSNEWAQFENGKWRKVTSKNAGEKNNFTHLPRTLSDLKNLKRFICGGDWNNENKTWNRWRIKNIYNVTRVETLEYLNLSNNEIGSIKGLGNLRQLKFAHLNNNVISQTSDLSELVFIEELNISNNEIKSVTFLKDLASLKTLDIHSNKITDLSPLENLIKKLGVENSKWKLDTINVARNPLELPPMEMINLGKEAVLSTFKDIKSSGKYINKDIKIVLVGNSEVGKTTLAKYLDKEKDLDVPHLATHWMVEKEVRSKYKINSIGEECVIHLFDFGGQDYYHDTHHLFYSANTVYILLWDKATNNLKLRNYTQENGGQKYELQTQDYPIKYWLDSVKHYIKDVEAENFEFEIPRSKTYNSSLLLIQNKVGEIGDVVHLNNEALNKNYGFIYDFLSLSILPPKRNLTQFDSVLTEILNSTSIIGAVLPKFYGVIKEKLKTYSDKPILSLNEFLEYCNALLEIKIDINQSKLLARYLDQIGLLLYLERINDGKVYVDKAWLVERIHKVLIGLPNKNGQLAIQDIIKSITPKEAVDIKIIQDQAIDIRDVMLEFKMIFKHPYYDYFIAPLYLPAMPSDAVKLFLSEKKIPYRRFEFAGFIQKQIILSFFQTYGKDILGSNSDSKSESYYYWKDGLIIKDPGTEQLVMIKFNLGQDEGNAYIDIFNLGGKNEQLIKAIANYIKEINKEYDTEEMVSLNGIDFVSIDVLNKNARKGKWLFTEQRIIEEAEIKKDEKLFKLKDYEMFIEEEVKRKKVVISYSKKDLSQIHTLTRYLRPLVDWGLIEEPWYCTLQNPAAEWDASIQAKFAEADIVFFMVSEHFYSTSYILEKEVKHTITRYNRDKSVKIIPVILEPYNWSRPGEWDLQRFSALPYQAKAISDFKSPKLAWNTITESVKMMIEKDLDPLKSDLISRELQEIYERQVAGKLDNNS